MPETMTCPSCGKEFPANEYKIGEAGNPICPECFQKELDEYFPPEEKEKTPCSRKKSTAAKPSAQQQPIINPNIETAISRNNISLQEGTVFQGTIDIPENNPATPSPYAEIFNNPDSVRQAFICSEILNRKYQ